MKIEINYRTLEAVECSTRYPCEEAGEPCDYCHCNYIEIEDCKPYSLIELVEEDTNNPCNNLQIACINWLQSTVDYHHPSLNWLYGGPVSFRGKFVYYGEDLVGEINHQTDLGAAMIAIVNEDWLKFVECLCKLEYGFISKDLEHSSKAILGSIDINSFEHDSKVTRLLQNNKQDSPKGKLSYIPPIIVKQLPNGNYKIIDGHHRIASSILEGKDHLEALILS